MEQGKPQSDRPAERFADYDGPSLASLAYHCRYIIRYVLVGETSLVWEPDKRNPVSKR
jgi:hypothetical protein